MFVLVSRLLRPYRTRILIALGGSALACGLNLPIPFLVQAILGRTESEGVRFLLLALAMIFALQALVHCVVGRALGWISLDLSRDLRERLYQRLQNVGLSYFDRTPSGAILSRMMDDVAAVQSLANGPNIALFVELATATVVVGFLGARSVLMLGVVAVLTPLFLVVFFVIGQKIRRGADDVRQQLDQVFSHLKTKFDGICVVKAHAREEAEIARFAEQMDAAHEPRLRVERLSALLSSLALAGVGIGSASVFAVAAYECLNGRMTPAEVAATGALACLLFAPLPRIADAISVLQQASVSLKRLDEILELPDGFTQTKTESSPLLLANPCGVVEFDRVHFQYRDDCPVLEGISARIEAGMKIALVGPTGCGKTTLLNLLLRFYEPTAGEIRLDGIPIRLLCVRDLRRHIGVVSQDASLFRGSVADNIRYGVPGADMAHIEAAARAAHVHEFAEKLPLGYDTIVGEGGHKLSAGQRQRITIARALCKNPALIILDEATSSLDSESESLIQDALANLLRGRTTFVIAHRLATITDADRILVMRHGRIIQAGTHDELLTETGALYDELCRRQFGEEVTNCA